jgi:hypothetical protein
MMPSRSVTVEREHGVTARYEIRGLVGSGGSATVHEVFDSVRGMTLAMKRLAGEALLNPSARLLFRREYRTLLELSHPAIVRVYDYGVHQGAPYYTMEIAAGADVRALSPLPWREACLVLRDVVSALSLLHSRRLVHRDVSAGNVRRSPERRGKLLDFGSLCPMGVAPEIAGTPPFVAPESLDGRPLDGRSDLYSVGALAYFLLTGRHAYPVARLSELKRAWSTPIVPPSRLSPGVPESLDALVLSLLDPNPLARPVAASEVFDRLSTVAELDRDESGAVALGYLSTPTLVGRDDVVARFRKRLLSADRGRGSTLIIEGKPGSGRSRLLGRLVTEANLANLVTLCATGADGQSRVFGVMHTLARRLVESHPECAKDVAIDMAVLETLGISGAFDFRPSGIALGWRTRVDGVAAWFSNIAARVPLALAIDDIDDIDDASMAVIAKLSEAALSRRLVLVATARSGTHAPRFRRIGGSHTLRALRAGETRALVESIFGDAQGVDMISAWVHELSQGSPRVAVESCQHLVDRALARYENGAWVLPVSLSGARLPADLEQAILSRVRGLGARARTLAEGFSLCVEARAHAGRRVLPVRRGRAAAAPGVRCAAGRARPRRDALGARRARRSPGPGGARRRSHLRSRRDASRAAAIHLQRDGSGAPPPIGGDLPGQIAPCEHRRRPPSAAGGGRGGGVRDARTIHRRARRLRRARLSLLAFSGRRSAPRALARLGLRQRSADRRHPEDWHAALRQRLPGVRRHRTIRAQDHGGARARDRARVLGRAVARR